MIMGRSELAVSKMAFTPGALTADNDLRIVSMTIAAYDYLATLPAEYQFYKSSNRTSSGLVLFVLIRYTSIIVLVVSNVGFFHHGFTPNTCSYFHLAAPALKVVQIMVSQAILAIRAYNISQRKRWVGRALLLVYIMATGVRFLGSAICSSASIHPHRAISTWSFYLVAMLFDCLTLSISFFYLMKVRAIAFSGSALWLVKVILYDGLGYFVVLTLMNAVNIVLFRGTGDAIQNSGASLGYSVTWIMSQRILIHLHETRMKHNSVVVAPTNRAITSTVRFDGEAKHKTNIKRNDTPGSPDECGNTETDFDLEVRVERSIVVDHGGLQAKDSRERDYYASPKSFLEREYHDV
ncbi:hypothetical protein EDB83DRAFT_2424138 [Lactarius deliciosus]|nr:hypothetical protein EDB83DRAFT_2463559 [Lactarius deliciosus]KAH9027464.1 hypothetical protein EDB83DRAFT_2424138 [Lactarius deliciosus]